MKILVPIKRVPSTDEPVRVSPGGSGVEPASSYMINPFDAIALEEAIRFREQQNGAGVEVVAVSIGGVDCESELRTALAMGADRPMRVSHEDAIDSWSVAQLLAAVVSREKPDLVLMGKQAVDNDSNQAGQMLAGLLDWPQATFASKIEVLSDRRVQVARETDRGLERVVIRLPAVITTDLRLNEPRYASLPALMRVKKRSIEVITPAELAITPAPRIRRRRIEQFAIDRQCVRVADAADLVQRLRSEAKVI